jgi:uncharacterized protein (TIGR03382 family)
VSDGTSGSTASVTVTVTAPASTPPDPGGCGCSAQGGNPAGLAPFLLGLALLRRRRVGPAAR